MRLLLLLSLLLVLPLLGCPPEDDGEIPDTLWEPELDDADSGTLDFGEVETNTLVEESITVTNNTESNLSFTLDVDLDGFLVSFPDGEITLEPGTEYSISPRLNPSQPGDYSGSVAFEFDDRVINWTVQATAI